jgi:antitoxin component of MazEF toxin-antitoxin module
MISVKERLIHEIEQSSERVATELTEYLTFLQSRERKKRYDLDAMLATITEDQLHPETDTGYSVGNEVG